MLKKKTIRCLQILPRTLFLNLTLAINKYQRVYNYNMGDNDSIMSIKYPKIGNRCPAHAVGVECTS